MKKLKIIGLGRCIIGHLNNSLNEDYSNKVTFKHHYLLNYNTCLHSTILDNDISQIKSLSCKPTLNDQLFCLDNLEEFDVCAIEIFPPAQLYTNGSILTCFEDFTNELKEAGFYKIQCDDKEYNKNYLDAIEKLVKKIRELNKSIKIILVNGEIASQGTNKIGSLRLFNLLENVKSSSFLKNDFIKLLDMNKLVEILSKEKYATFETAFPHIYIRYTNEFKFIEVSRDTKHAIPQVRKFFLQYFCTLIEEFGFKMPIIEVEKIILSHFDKELAIRSKKYIERYNTSPIILEELENSKFFSLFTTYSLITKNKDSFNHIVNFIKKLSLLKLQSDDLKLYFYHIRSVCAFEIETNSGLINILLNLANQITLFTKSDLEKCSNFALLWIKNIYLVYSNIGDNYQSNLIESIKLFNTNLNKNQFLMNFDEIQSIAQYTKETLTNNFH